MNILSLFDGISCGRIALEKLGIPIENYYAAEIDKYAIQIAQKNFPSTIQLGDVYNIDYSKLPKIDLILGGSPCTYWSIAKKDREVTSSGIGFDLFMQYVRALRECNPKYFLYENNYSIHKDIKDAISEKLGVPHIMINSALVSAQNRKRCYWTNIPGVVAPSDRGIKLKDILEENVDSKYIISEKHTRAMKACRKSKKLNIPDVEKKCGTLIASYYKIPQDGPYIEVKPILYNSYNQSVASDKSFTLGTNPQCLTAITGQAVLSPIRVGSVGKGGQGQRIYAVEGKSVNLTANGGGQGAKTGLYKIDLPDGYYAVRKLTPVEAERLQTVPDNFTLGVSDTQRYRALGNGWTVEVISHILSFMEA